MTVHPRMKRWPQPHDTGEVYLCYPVGTTPDDTYDAPVLSSSGTLEEAQRDARVFGGAEIYVCSYHASDSGRDDYADDERFVERCE